MLVEYNLFLFSGGGARLPTWWLYPASCQSTTALIDSQFEQAKVWLWKWNLIMVWKKPLQRAIKVSSYGYVNGDLKLNLNKINTISRFSQRSFLIFREVSWYLSFHQQPRARGKLSVIQPGFIRWELNGPWIWEIDHETFWVYLRLLKVLL